uniref:Pentatricopeptide repeat-containing protein At3g02650, mitochondrial-like n=1 Tax=Cicer arietinum TaxID=3827 RepID=A0A1S2XVQ1_CICAR|nr:pentatricopeptide repeat-containing protein At3g02650, mitochondrial-like [Cicer arietinum]
MLQQAASICQKMALHPETLLPDDGDMLDYMLSWFSGNNMIKEAYALYLAANEKRKRNPNWSLQVDMLLPTTMIRVLCSEKETVHLALEMLTDINIPEEVEQWEKGSKLSLCLLVVEALCWFKDFDAAKQLIFKMIADGPLPPPSTAVFNVIITAYVKAGEIGQAFEMLMLSESIGLSTSHVLTCGFSRSDGMKETRKILEEAKNKDSKLFIALLYHTLIVGYFKQLKYEKALKLLTQMKDFSVFCTNLDEYHKLIHSLRLKAMDRKIEREQLEELEPIDREMAEEQLYEMGYVDSSMAEEQLEEMNLNIRASV